MYEWGVGIDLDFKTNALILALNMCFNICHIVMVVIDFSPSIVSPFNTQMIFMPTF